MFSTSEEEYSDPDPVFFGDDTDEDEDCIIVKEVSCQGRISLRAMGGFDRTPPPTPRPLPPSVVPLENDMRVWRDQAEKANAEIQIRELLGPKGMDNEAIDPRDVLSLIDDIKAKGKSDREWLETELDTAMQVRDQYNRDFANLSDRLRQVTRQRDEAQAWYGALYQGYVEEVELADRRRAEAEAEAGRLRGRRSRAAFWRPLTGFSRSHAKMLSLLLFLCGLWALLPHAAASSIPKDRSGSSSTNTAEGEVMFRPVGRLHLMRHMVHITFNDRPYEFRRTCLKLEQFRAMSQPYMTLKDAWTFEDKMRRVCRDVDAWPLDPYKTEIGYRKKRSLIAGVLAFGATVFSTLSLFGSGDTTKEIANLKASQRDTNRLLEVQYTRLSALEVAAKDFNTSLHELWDYSQEISHQLMFLRWMVDLETLEVAVNRMERGFNHLLSTNRVSTDFLDLSKATEAWHQVLEKAELDGTTAPGKSPTTLYQLPASMIWHPNGTLEVFVHVPMSDRTMRLLELQDTPVAVSNEEEAVILEVDPGSRLIAVDEDHTAFVEVTDHFLRSCINIGADYFCPDVSILRKDFGETCLSALLTNAREHIHDQCPVKKTARAFLTASTKTSLVLFSEEEITVTTACKGLPSKAVRVKGRQVFPRRQGCHISSTRFLSRDPEEDQTIDAEIVRHVIDVDPDRWTGGRSAADFKKSIAKLDKVHLHEDEEVGQLLGRLKEREEPPVLHQGHGIGLASAVSSVALALVGVAVWAWRRAGKQKASMRAAAQTLSALAANLDTQPATQEARD